MAYTKINWRNDEVALSDTNLNHMEQGIYDAHEAISTLQATLETVINERVLAGKPIGTIEINTTGVNPSTYLGGTWVAWGSGRVPVGVDTTQEEFNTAEKNGGEKAVTLTTAQMPQHHHSYEHRPGSVIAGLKQGTGGAIDELMGFVDMITEVTGDVGNGQAHNNLQPYITCYMWKRTA